MNGVSKCLIRSWGAEIPHPVSRQVVWRSFVLIRRLEYQCSDPLGEVGDLGDVKEGAEPVVAGFDIQLLKK